MDYETWEKESYLRNRQTEMELDARHKFERMESDHRRMIVHNDRSFNAENITLIEVACVLIIIVGAARLIGLV